MGSDTSRSNLVGSFVLIRVAPYQIKMTEMSAQSAPPQAERQVSLSTQTWNKKSRNHILIIALLERTGFVLKTKNIAEILISLNNLECNKMFRCPMVSRCSWSQGQRIASRVKGGPRILRIAAGSQPNRVRLAWIPDPGRGRTLLLPRAPNYFRLPSPLAN